MCLQVGTRAALDRNEAWSDMMRLQVEVVPHGDIEVGLEKPQSVGFCKVKGMRHSKCGGFSVEQPKE
ncbi:hypothetical protein GOP47_0016283 [Adiantum capillus-veneris]|uniref:Uncharacterized protein n=1 Tax=Adiantum capillus-veneris TaxID=13818 RepID=A0A9D4UIA7_ADICA|nr:hypothetical protein GOP47_0016283 [Adiantum capillus-veneris]